MPSKKGGSPEKGQQAKFEQEIKNLKDDNTLLECEVERLTGEVQKLKEESAVKEQHQEQSGIALEEVSARLESYVRDNTKLCEHNNQLDEELAREKQHNEVIQEQLSEVRKQNRDLSMELKAAEIQLQQVKINHQSSDKVEPVNTTKVRMPMPSIDKFEGKNWEGFISQFTSLANYFNWTPKDKCFQLEQHLAGEAKQFLYHKCGEEVRSSYENAERALKQRFGNSCSRDNIMTKLESLKLGQRDSIAEFCTDIAYLVRQAYPHLDDHTRAEIEVDYFIKGLVDPGMIRTVGNQAPDSLDTARRLAETYMRLEDQMRPRKSNLRQVTFKEPDESFVTEEKLLQFGEDLVKRFEETLAKVQDARKPVCFHCKRPGHFARNCKYQHGRNQQRERGPGRNAWQQWQEGPRYPDNEGSGPYHTYQPSQGMRNDGSPPPPPPGQHQMQRGANGGMNHLQGN